MIVKLIRKAGKLKGLLLLFRERSQRDYREAEEMKNTVKVYFRHSLFKVDLLLKKMITIQQAFLMGTFQATGVRLN